MKRILNIMDPVVKAYVHHGFPLSIIGREWVDSGWIYNRFIQLEYHIHNPDDKFIDFIYYNFFRQDDVFIEAFYQMPYETEKDVKQFLKMIKELIIGGAYIFGLWDERHIPGTSVYGRQFTPHAYLIYGFDDKKSKMYSEGYLKDRHWHRFEISYRDYLNAVIGEDGRDAEGFVGFNCYYRNGVPVDGLDEKQVKSELKSYLDSSSEGNREGILYGVNGIIQMYEDFERICTYKGKIPWQSLYIVFEHKQMMLQRVKRLREKGISLDSDWIERYEGICRNFNLIVNFGVKYVRDGEIKWGGKMNELAKQELEVEQDLLWKLYDSI